MLRWRHLPKAGPQLDAEPAPTDNSRFPAARIQSGRDPNLVVR